MPMAHIRKVGGEHDLYHVHFLDQHGGTDPGYGQGRPGERPDQGLPGGRPNRPDQGLPGSGGRPDQGLPGSGGRPDQGLPGNQPGIDNTLPGGRPNIPNNELPTTPPPQVAPGQTLIMIRKDGKWVWAAIPQGQPVPNPLPPTTPPAQPKAA